MRKLTNCVSKTYVSESCIFFNSKLMPIFIPHLQASVAIMGSITIMSDIHTTTSRGKVEADMYVVLKGESIRIKLS